MPADSTSPANSCPSMVILFGLPSPLYIRKRSRSERGILRLRISQSPAVTVVARTLIRTSLALGVGFSTSLSWRTSGGPYFVQTIAFICFRQTYIDPHGVRYKVGRGVRPTVSTL